MCLQFFALDLCRQNLKGVHHWWVLRIEPSDHSLFQRICVKNFLFCHVFKAVGHVLHISLFRNERKFLLLVKYFYMKMHHLWKIPLRGISLQKYLPFTFTFPCSTFIYSVSPFCIPSCVSTRIYASGSPCVKILIWYAIKYFSFYSNFLWSLYTVFTILTIRTIVVTCSRTNLHIHFAHCPVRDTILIL